MNSYAGIGSRKTPYKVLSYMQSLGKVLSHFMILRSGGATGADTAFERGCDIGNGAKETYLPWENYSSSSKSIPVQRLPNFHLAQEIASKFHPAWSRCSTAARALLARNTYQIVGQDLNTPVDFIVCWTPGGTGQGSTGQALRIAKYLDIPIYDLAVPGASDALETYIVERFL